MTGTVARTPPGTPGPLRSPGAPGAPGAPGSPGRPRHGARPLRPETPWRLLLPPLLVAAAFALTIVAGLVVRSTPPLRELDIAIYHAFNGLACGATGSEPFYNLIWTALNQPALNYYVLYGITFAYVLLRRREQWLRLLVVTALIAGLGYISNPIIWHWAWGPRPFTVTSACIAHPEWEAIWSQYSSFPSGHARETAAELTAMVTFWPAALLPAVAYMALLAFSRLYLGVHFPSDVLIGAVLGLAIAKIAFLSYDVYVRRWRDGWRDARRTRAPGATSHDRETALTAPGRSNDNGAAG